MMYSRYPIPNIVNPDRILVAKKSRKFANQQEDWSNGKKSIYIALMQRLAGMGYESALSSIPEGKYNVFMDISREIIPKDNSYYFGGMPYEDAHRLITGSESFQSINCYSYLILYGALYWQSPIFYAIIILICSI